MTAGSGTMKGKKVPASADERVHAIPSTTIGSMSSFNADGAGPA
ncbi:MAG TPA: hypothetical protein VL122_00530 [Nitrospirota bacterium]|nr:hypothetical protein [Nitrospirota bacterium]